MTICTVDTFGLILSVLSKSTCINELAATPKRPPLINKNVPTNTKKISRFISLDQAEMDTFISKLQVKQLKRKELLLWEGQVCKNSYFINRGCLRYYYELV